MFILCTTIKVILTYIYLLIYYINKFYSMNKIKIKFKMNVLMFYTTEMQIKFK